MINVTSVTSHEIDGFAAGADLIITNTYQASVEGFMEHLGLSREQGRALIARAVSLAKRARSIYLEEYQDQLENGLFMFLISFRSNILTKLQ